MLFKQSSRNRVLFVPVLRAQTAGLSVHSRLADMLVRNKSTFKTRRIVAVPAATMLKVVGAVDHYHKFVPHCLESRVLEQDRMGLPSLAELRVGWELFDEKFVSKIEHNPDSIIASLGDTSLLKELHCHWDIRPVDDTRCAVTVYLSYNFRNPIYNAVTQSLGPRISRKMIEAFTEQAVTVVN